MNLLARVYKIDPKNNYYKQITTTFSALVSIERLNVAAHLVVRPDQATYTWANSTADLEQLLPWILRWCFKRSARIPATSLSLSTEGSTLYGWV